MTETLTGPDAPLGRLLIADDEPELLAALCEMLADQGYETTGCPCAEEALEQLREREFDLLLSDMMMPGMDGIDLLAAALKLDPHLVGIIMTGQATVSTAVEAMKVGACDYVTKPFKLASLLPVLQRAMELRRLRLENVQLRQAVTIYEFGQTVSQTREVTTILDRIADGAQQLCDADEVSILLPTGAGDELYVAAVRGEGRGELLGQRVAVDQSIAGWVAKQRETLSLEGVVDDPRFEPLHRRNDVAASISLPLLTGGRLVGVLLAGVLNVNYTRGGRSFTSGVKKALSILASIAAAALESSLLLEQLQEANHRLQESLAHLEKTQAQMLEQERLRALGQMASGIAHDFNNTLAPILGFTDLLLRFPEHLDDRPKLTEYLEIVRLAAGDAAGVVSRLREFGRPREATERFAPVNLPALLDQVLVLTQPRWRDQARAAGRHVTVRLETEAVPPVPGDEGQLREALTNLVFNAVDALPEGGAIILRTALCADGVRVDVQDNGTGMTEEVRRRCLEPFFSTKGDDGTGLGLAMTYGVVHRHDGRIEIESAPGQGTTFRITLPVAGQPAATCSTAERVDAPAGLNVLVVDDEALVRQVTNAFLTAAGHTVEAAAGGREALEKLVARRFDLVVTDQSMPEMSGEQLAAAVKSLSPGTPVILLTGFGSLMQSCPDGIDLVLAKPVTVDHLLDGVSKVLGAAAAPGAPGAPGGRALQRPEEVAV